MSVIISLLTACSDDSENTTEQGEIRLKTDIWQMMEGSRATTFDNPTALQGEAHFTCAAYEAGTLTPYIATTTVDWSTTNTQWEFNGGASHYYWPLPATPGGAYPSLDFFGYMPATPPAYISDLTYTADHNVTFTCSSLPMTNAGQGSSLKEFIYGRALGQNKGNASSGVPLVFQHPFTKIKMQLKEGHPAITINKITFKTIKNNGSYSHSGGWSPSGDATDLVLTLDQAFAYDVAAQEIGTYIMIPQEWEGDIEVEATWTDWGEQLKHALSTKVSTVTWAAGTCYTYTFDITETDLIVNTEKFTEQW